MSVKVKIRENKCIAIQVEYLDFDKNMTGRKNAWTVSTYRCPIQSLRKLF